MRFHAYSPEWQDHVVDLADRVFGEGYFAHPAKIASDPNDCMSLCVAGDSELAGFARGRLLPQHGLGDFLQQRVAELPSDLVDADAAGVVGTILTVTVAPEHRGKGVATKLLTIVHDRLVGLGGDKLIATFKRGLRDRTVDGLMGRLGFEFWARLPTYQKDRCERGEFKCHNRVNGCTCEALFYRKVVY